MKVRTADVDIIFKLQFLHVLHGETVFLILYILYIHSCGGQALLKYKFLYIQMIVGISEFK